MMKTGYEATLREEQLNNPIDTDTLLLLERTINFDVFGNIPFTMRNWNTKT